MRKKITEPLILGQKADQPQSKNDEKDKKAVVVTESSELNNKGLIFISDIYEEPTETAQKTFQKAPQQSSSKISASQNLQEMLKLNVANRMMKETTKIRRYVTMAEEMKKMKNAVSSQGIYQEYCSKFSQNYLNYWNIEKEVFSQFLSNPKMLDYVIPQSARQTLGFKPEMFMHVGGDDLTIDQHKEIDKLDKQNMEVDFSRSWIQYLYLNGVCDEKFKMVLTEFSETKHCNQGNTNVKDQNNEKRKQVYEKNEDLKEEKAFLFKTLKLFDREGLVANIVTEMIEDTKIDQVKFNQNKNMFSTNVSIIEWRLNQAADLSKIDDEHNLYFFQRQYWRDKQSNLENCHLQLMRLDLISLFKAGQMNLAPVKGYCIKEQQNKLRNVLFSREIQESATSFDTEEDFLDSQYLLLQGYQDRQVQICSLKDIKSSGNKQDEVILHARSGLSEMIFNVFHLEDTYKIKDFSMQKMVFVTASSSQILNFEFKLNKDEEGKKLPRLDQINGDDVSVLQFRKGKPDFSIVSQSKAATQVDYQMQQLSNPMIPTHIESLNVKLIGSEKQETTYYFYIDTSNSVIPLHPLPTEKVHYLRLIELIKKEFQINDAEKDIESNSTVYHQEKNLPIKAYTGIKTEDLIQILKLDKDAAHKITMQGMPHTFFLATESREQILTLIIPQQVVKPLYVWSQKQPEDNNSNLIQHVKINEKNQPPNLDYLLDKQINQLQFQTKKQAQEGKKKGNQRYEHEVNLSQRGDFIPSILHLDYKSCKLEKCSKDPTEVKSIFTSTQRNKMVEQFYKVKILDSNNEFRNINAYNTNEFLKEFNQNLWNKIIPLQFMKEALSSPGKKKLKNEVVDSKELDALQLEIKMEYYSVFLKGKEDHYFFVFSLAFNYKGGRIRSYFIVIKNQKQMDSVFYGGNLLFQFTDQLMFFYDQQTLVERDFSTINKEMKGLLDVENHDIEENEQKLKTSDSKKKLQKLKLVFPAAADDRTTPNFVAFVCQTKVNIQKIERAFVVYDILNERFTVQQIQMRLKNQELASRDIEGFENIMLCQTSDFVTDEKSQDYNTFCQAKFSMLAVSVQEVGLIKIRDFIVTLKKSQTKKNKTDTYIQLMGMKHVFFSNDFIKKVNYDLLANFSFVVPLYHETQVRRNKKKTNVIQFRKTNSEQGSDREDQKTQDDDMLGTGETFKQIDGLKLVLIIENISSEIDGESNHIILNFPETICNVMYTCRSDLVLMGNLHQQLSERKSEYCQIITQRLSNKALSTGKKDIKYGEPILNNSEAIIVLEKFSKKMLSLQIPELKYVVLNSYQTLLTKNFFQNQELLEGKSLCDIALTDYQIVCDACADVLQSTQDRNDPNTLLKKICENDSYRKKVMEQLEFNDFTYLLNLDFDFKGTINRGMDCGAEQSIKVIFQTVFEYGKSSSYYYDMIMIDLLELMKSRNFDLDFFFTHRLDLGEQSFKCTFERELLDFNLPQYSLKENQVQIIKEANIFDEVRERELNKMIIDQENKNQLLQPNKVATNKVEHCYINLAIIQLSAKINVEEDQEVQDFVAYFKEMNHLALAKMIAIKLQSQDLNFYKLWPVQRIINMQWESSKIVLFTQFFVFCAFYLLPLIFVILTHKNYRDLMWELQHEVPTKDDVYQISKRSLWESVKSIYEQHHPFCSSALKLCMMTRILFFINELFQIKENKWDYFSSAWNWFDLSEFFGFMIFQLTLYGYIECTVDFVPEIVYCVIILAFMKMMFFIRMSESLGFITNMIFNCLIALIPFTITFLFFLLLFTVLLMVLNNDIDAEVAEGAEFLPKFQQAILQTFRTSIGELGLPQYAQIYSQEDSFHKYLNIYMIWCTWYTQCFFNLVVMLNFIIAVINSAYEEIKEKQTMISFRNKAEMNLEVLELKRNLFNLDPFILVLFSQMKKDSNQETDPNQTRFDQVKKMFENQSRVQEVYNEQVKRSLTDIQLKQQDVMQQVKTTFAPCVPPPLPSSRDNQQSVVLNQALNELKDFKMQVQEEVNKLKHQQVPIAPQNSHSHGQGGDSSVLAQRVQLQDQEIHQLKTLIFEADIQLKKEINRNQLQIVKLMDKINLLEKGLDPQQNPHTTGQFRFRNSQKHTHENEEHKFSSVETSKMTKSRVSINSFNSPQHEEEKQQLFPYDQTVEAPKIQVVLSTQKPKETKEIIQTKDLQKSLSTPRIEYSPKSNKVNLWQTSNTQSRSVPQKKMMPQKESSPLRKIGTIDLKKKDTKQP